MTEYTPAGTIRMPKGLSQHAQQKYIKISKAAADLHERFPNETDMSLVNRYLVDFVEAEKKHDEVIRGLRENTIDARTGEKIPLEGDFLKAKSIKMRNEFLKTFLEDTVPQYSPKAQETWKKVATRLKPVSIPGLAIRQFYDENKRSETKGAVQWAGIIGGIAGAAFVFKQVGGFGAGAIGIIATALAAISAAWITNMGKDSVVNFMDKYHNKDKTKGQEKDKTPDGKGNTTGQSTDTPAQDQGQSQEEYVSVGRQETEANFSTMVDRGEEPDLPLGDPDPEIPTTSNLAMTTTGEAQGTDKTNEPSYVKL